MQPNHDPMTSSIPKNFEISKRVETLLNRLAGYMAGEIPDSHDLEQLFEPEASPIKKEPTVDNKTTFDDATTDFTKEEDDGKLIAKFKTPFGP